MRRRRIDGVGSRVGVPRRDRAFSSTETFSKLVTLTIVDVLCVVCSVFFSHGTVKSLTLMPALARARAKSATRSQLRFSHSEEVPLRRGAPCALGDRSSAGRMVALLAAGSGYPRNSAREQKEAVAAA